MAKVYPQTLPSPSPSSSPSSSSLCSETESETFTIWMKSLIYHTNGCTVFDSNGDIVYRVDNYDRKCSREVFLMDLRGKVLFTIRKKKFSILGGWEGFRWIESERSKKASFGVKKLYRTASRKSNQSVCEINVGFERFSLVKMDGKLAFRIININGEVVAEAKRKVSWNGILLGDDVLSLNANSQIERSLIMALVTVYGLIRRQM
ncbi:protein LURP-one-related 4 isoform X2 [Benincasa hispida]|uniref:protein LURP-one-related 4 isoform X2 n=1 Tax=Benincasa hispida TaxID=102211 RepID=UPI00190156B4|nr:protein LURP-one-related 4 isoform X2 [Benincasa hispida]